MEQVGYLKTSIYIIYERLCYCFRARQSLKFGNIEYYLGQVHRDIMEEKENESFIAAVHEMSTGCSQKWPLTKAVDREMIQ